MEVTPGRNVITRFFQQPVAAGILLAVISFLFYTPALDNQFLRYDDDTYVYDNGLIQDLSAESVLWIFANPYFRSYTPVTLLSHALDFKIWKMDPWGHHLANLILHSMNTLWVYLLSVMILKMTRIENGSRRPLLTPPSSFTIIAAGAIAALLYALHPMRVETVAWVSDRKDLLFAAFGLPSCMAYIKYSTARETPKALPWYLVSLGLLVLALLSKSIAVTIPIVFLLLDVFLLHPGRWKELRKALLLEKAPFLIACAFVVIMAMKGATGNLPNEIVANMSTTERLLLPFYSILFYVWKTLWPSNLTAIYGSPGIPLMVLSVPVVLGVTAACYFLLRRWKGVMLAWLSYIVVLAPTITGLSAGIQPWADRYSYVAAVSLFCVLAGGIHILLERYRESTSRKALYGSVAGLAVVLAGILGYISLRQIPIWRDTVSLWARAVETSPEVPMTHANLGAAYYARGEVDRAIELYYVALAMKPGYGDALYDLGVAYEAKGEKTKAAELYRRVIELHPAYIDAYVNLGNLLVEDGKLDDAISSYEIASGLDRADPDPYYNMGVAYYRKGEIQKAFELFRETLARSPGYTKAMYNIGIIHAQAGNEGAALEFFTRAARAGFVDAQNLLRERGYSWQEQ